MVGVAGFEPGGLFVPKPPRDANCQVCGMAHLGALSVGVRWRPPLSVVVVTQLVTRFPRACSGAARSQAAIGYAHGSGGRGPASSNCASSLLGFITHLPGG